MDFIENKGGLCVISEHALKSLNPVDSLEHLVCTKPLYRICMQPGEIFSPSCILYSSLGTLLTIHESLVESLQGTSMLQADSIFSKVSSAKQSVIQCLHACLI